MKKIFAPLFVLLGVLLGFMQSAYAVIDVTAATTGISDAQVAILAVIAALMSLATTAYGIMMVYRFLARKSGVS